MADKELLHKIVEMQERVIAQMDSLKDQDLVTNDLRKAADKAQEWARAVMKEEGNDKSYREWPPKQFAHDSRSTSTRSETTRARNSCASTSSSSESCPTTPITSTSRLHPVIALGLSWH